MQDASWFEKAIFDWFSKRSDLVALATPLVIFVVTCGLGFAILALVYRPSTPFLGWMFSVVLIAGLGLYLIMSFALGAMFTRTNRFELLQLHQAMRDIQAGLVASSKAAGGIFVTCGVFDESALAFAKANPSLQLIGGEQLRDLVHGTAQQMQTDSASLCPVWGSPMRLTKGRYGTFLGCVNFPACKGWLRLRGEAAAPSSKYDARPPHRCRI